KNASIAESLLQAGANVNLKQEHGFTPLRLTLNTGSPELLKLLLAHKPDLGVQDNDGFTLLQAAIYDPSYGVSVEMLEALFAAGADVNAPYKPIGNAAYLNRNSPSTGNRI